MQIVKKRKFGELVSDCFQFFKLYGKNYFKSYLIINGGILILLFAVIFVGYGDLFQQIFAGNVGGQAYFFEQYFENNPVIFFTILFLVLALFFLLSIINYSFPIFYLHRMSKGQYDITTGDMVQDIKQNMGRLIVFFFFSLIVFIPLFLISGGIVVLLMFLIVGFFVAMIFIPAAINIVNFTLFDFIDRKSDFFQAFQYAVKIQFSGGFWKYMGATLILYFILNTVSSVFSFLPFFILGANDFFVVRDGGSELESSLGLIGIISLVIYFLGILVTLILSNLLYINTGFMYYDARQDLHHEQALSEIDLIGKSED